PALVLMISFVGRRAGATVSMLPLWAKVKHLGGLYSLASVSRWTILLSAALALLFFIVAFVCLRAQRWRPFELGDGLLWVAVIFALIFFVAPSELAGGGFINHRLNLFPFLVLILWFGTFDHPLWRRRSIQIAAAGIALAFLAVFTSMYARV